MSEETGQKHTKPKNFWKDLFSENDYGPESHRIINGRRCVYWTDDMWISKRGIERDESD